MAEQSRSDDSRRPCEKRRSPYFGVKIMAATFGLLSILWAAATVYLMFAHNPQGESCAYVKPGEPYHLVLDGMPCRITTAALVDFTLIIFVILIPAQVPALIFWAVQAYQDRLRKRLEALPPTDLQRLYDEWVAENRWRNGGKADE